MYVKFHCPTVKYTKLVTNHIFVQKTSHMPGSTVV